jgi:hypothetical protein
VVKIIKHAIVNDGSWGPFGQERSAMPKAHQDESMLHGQDILKKMLQDLK